MWFTVVMDVASCELHAVNAISVIRLGSEGYPRSLLSGLLFYFQLVFLYYTQMRVFRVGPAGEVHSCSWVKSLGENTGKPLGGEYYTSPADSAAFWAIGRFSHFFLTICL